MAAKILAVLAPQRLGYQHLHLLINIHTFFCNFKVILSQLSFDSTKLLFTTSTLERTLFALTVSMRMEMRELLIFILESA